MPVKGLKRGLNEADTQFLSLEAGCPPILIVDFSLLLSFVRRTCITKKQFVSKGTYDMGVRSTRSYVGQPLIKAKAGINLSFPLIVIII